MAPASTAIHRIPARSLLRDRAAWPRSADLGLAGSAAVLQLGAAYIATRQHGPGWSLGILDVLLLLAGPAALLARRRHPVAVMGIAFLAALGPRADRAAYISLILSVFLVITNGHRRAGWAMLLAGYVASLWIVPPILGQATRTTLGGALAFAGWLAALGVAGEAVRIRRERTAAAVATRAADERARASAQRIGIARELHDVIGHNISLINLQAGIALDLFDTQPDHAREALAAIRGVSGEALEQLRAMLATLRDNEQEPVAPRSPTPSLEQLSELIAPARSAGLSVRVQRTGSVRPLGRPVELAAYRILQESLTNVARHAPGASVTIGLTYGSDGLELRVEDDGSPAHPTLCDATRPPVRSGSGIPGMRERAEALGGGLDAHRRRGGGFEVNARLPDGARR